MRNWRGADLTAADRALCAFAVKLTHHQDTMTPDDLDRLRHLGFSETAVFDAVQVAAFFNYITRVADAFGLEPEEFIHTHWGDEDKAQHNHSET